MQSAYGVIGGNQAEDGDKSFASDLKEAIIVLPWQLHQLQLVVANFALVLLECSESGR